MDVLLCLYCSDLTWVNFQVHTMTKVMKHWFDAVFWAMGKRVFHAEKQQWIWFSDVPLEASHKLLRKTFFHDCFPHRSVLVTNNGLYFTSNDFSSSLRLHINQKFADLYGNFLLEVLAALLIFCDKASFMFLIFLWNHLALNVHSLQYFNFKSSSKAVYK